MLSFLPTSLLRVVASFDGGGVSGGAAAKGVQRRETERASEKERGSKGKGQLLATQLRPAPRRAARPCGVLAGAGAATAVKSRRAEEEGAAVERGKEGGRDRAGWNGTADTSATALVRIEERELGETFSSQIGLFPLQRAQE